MFDWITDLLQRSGALGIALLMFGENLFPPIPSEMIMPLAGFNAARGDLNVFVAVLAGSVGSLLGAVFWYYVGRGVGSARLKLWAARYGRWLTVTPNDIDDACSWFNRHGGKAVFLGRLVPAVRSLISVPAGIAGMPLVPFLTYSALGTVAWTAILTGAGYFLESHYWKVADWVNPVSNVVIGVLVLWYLYRVVTFRHRAPPQD